MSKIVKFLSTVLMILLFISMAPNLVRNIKTQYQDSLKTQVKVAKVKIKNEIQDIENYSKQLTKYFKDNTIKAILLEIDSPGGSAGTSKALFNEIQLLKKDYPKPLICLSHQCCASGAYHIASTADYIIASSASIVGSIGVTVGFFNISKILKKYDVNYIDKHSGVYKTVGSSFIPSSPEQELMLQELSNNIYNQFTNDVATCRKLSLVDVDKWANGRVFTGEQALKLNLIDETGSKRNAIQKIKELALIKDEEEINWVTEEEPSVINKILNRYQNNLSLETESLIDALITKLETRFIHCN